MTVHPSWPAKPGLLKLSSATVVIEPARRRFSRDATLIRREKNRPRAGTPARRPAMPTRGAVE
jgi:hypothetical protein